MESLPTIVCFLFSRNYTVMAHFTVYFFFALTVKIQVSFRYPDVHIALSSGKQ
jgi:hypothetical protein